MRIKQSLLYVITFFTGFSFLIYEVAWNRYLSLVLGTTVTASTIVLSAFMAGLGTGSFFLGRKADKYKKTGINLAFIYIAIAGFSSIAYFLIKNFHDIFNNISSDYLLTNFFLYTYVFILLLIPGFFMGGVLPFIIKMLVHDDRPSNQIANVYAFETLGSALGGLFTGFLFLRIFGQSYTFLSATLLIILSASFLFLFFHKEYFIQDKASEKKPDYKANSTHSSRIALLSTFLIGFTLLSLQIIWIRIFKVYFTNTSYTFSLIAACVILGYSVGSYIYKRRQLKIKSRDTSMLKSLILLAVFLLTGLILSANLPEILMFPFKAFGEQAGLRIFLIPSLASLLIVLPPALVSGFAFPLACSMYSGKKERIGKDIGYVLMMNTSGALIGPVVAAFILIPSAGAGKSIMLLTFLLLLLSVFISKRIGHQSIFLYKNRVLLGISILIFVITLIINPVRFLPPSAHQSNIRLTDYKETSKGTIIVVNEPQKGFFGNSTFVDNSAVIGSNYDAVKAVKLVGHLPFFADLKCEQVLIIGFGIGITTSAIASHPEVKQIDCVELVPELLKSAKYYNAFNNAVYRDRRLKLMQGDGRHYLQMTEKKYDLISCDPTHPVLGSGNLYTKDYFLQCKAHLNPDGMVSQYLPLHKLRLNDLLGLIKTFYTVFPNSTLWLGQYHAVLLGKNGTGKIDFQKWKKNIQKVQPDMFLYLDPYHIAANMVMSPESIGNISEDIEINTDDLSYTEFFALDCFNPENLYENLKYISNNRSHVNEAFNNIEALSKMDTFINGNRKMTESLYFSLKGDSRQAVNALREACKVNPDNQEYPFLLKFYFGLEK